MLGLLDLFGTSSALPVTNSSQAAPAAIMNGTSTFVLNSTEAFIWLQEPAEDDSSLVKRGLPPRDRTFADHMENYGEKLPECYKKCLRSEDGKAQIHMGKDTLGKICGIKWPLFAWWSEHHIYYCVNGKGGCKGKEPHRKAYEWLKSTCGDKPS
ncbi:hypothetical protein Daus18300_008107 [Diaporthe australafricana]|uniref:Uncharacterized protein n=1 Tax=Diaporthe australafricana TaxID=127596 RepID=A0ABR3WK81_9PEZI